MSALEDRARAAGIDPDDARFEVVPGEGCFRYGDEVCRWCHRHSTRTPRLRCEVQQAEAEPGEVACCWCQEPAPAASRECAKCAERVALERKEARRRRRRISGPFGVYRDDGHGCVERVHPTELMIERLERSGPEDGGGWG